VHKPYLTIDSTEHSYEDTQEEALTTAEHYKNTWMEDVDHKVWLPVNVEMGVKSVAVYKRVGFYTWDEDGNPEYISEE